MSLLKKALEMRQWDLAAHTIVLAATRIVLQGETPDEKSGKEKKGKPKE
jgi:hypothetical protein